MHDLKVRYPGQVEAGDANYPWGKARNQVNEDDGVGTPWEEDLANDIIGSLHSVYYRFGKAPGNTTETALDAELGKVLERLAYQAVRSSCQFAGALTGAIPQAAFYEEAEGGFIYAPVAPFGSPKLQFLAGLTPIELDGTTTAGAMTLAYAGGYTLMGHSSPGASTSRLFVKSSGIEGPWTEVTGLASGTAAPKVFAHPSAKLIYVFDGATCYQYTPDEGIASVGTVPFTPTHVVISPTAGMVAIQSGTANRAHSADGGATWTSVDFGGGPNFEGIVWLEKSAQFIAFLKYSTGSQRHRRQTSADGLTWSDVSQARLEPFASDNSGADTIRAVVPINGLMLVCGISNDSTANLKIYASMNGGSSWQLLQAFPGGGVGDIITGIYPGKYGFLVSTGYAAYRFGT